MRTTIFAVFILVFAPISGLVVADNKSQQNLLEGEQNLILPTYSVAVQLAFERVSDLEQYSTEELDNTGEWLIERLSVLAQIDVLMALGLSIIDKS